MQGLQESYTLHSFAIRYDKEKSIKSCTIMIKNHEWSEMTMK